MRLAFSSVAILSLSAVGSHAFAPALSSSAMAARPTSRWTCTLKSTITQNDLTGLLNEYKSTVVPPVSTASYTATPPVEDVVDAAPNVVDAVMDVSSSATSVSSPEDLTGSSMRALSDAVTAATDAADKAAAAALAAASKVR